MGSSIVSAKEYIKMIMAV